MEAAAVEAASREIDRLMATPLAGQGEGMRIPGVPTLSRSIRAGSVAPTAFGAVSEADKKALTEWTQEVREVTRHPQSYSVQGTTGRILLHGIGH
jgi:hypothetical protein